MRTDDLIRTLAVAPPRPAMPMRTRLAMAVAAGLAVSAIVFIVLLGPRADIAQAMTSVRFALKPVEAAAFAALAGLAALRLAQPGVSARGFLSALFVVPGCLAAAVAIELAVVPPAQWGASLVGDNGAKCLSLIPLLSLAPLAALLVALRGGAPTRPVLTGAVAGLCAGGIGALLYATHCTDDSPLFVATWYTIAVACVTGLGALAGWRWLRW